MLVDALFIKCREADRVVSRAALVVSGICSDGYREILGVRIGDTDAHIITVSGKSPGSAGVAVKV